MLETYVNYFVGDRSRWASKVPTYDRVRYLQVYPGIDVVVARSGRGAEYDFVVQPGADPSQIRVRLSGADRIERTDAGDLKIQTATGSLVQSPPVATLLGVDGSRNVTPCTIRMLDETSFTFDVPAPDSAGHWRRTPDRPNRRVLHLSR